MVDKRVELRTAIAQVHDGHRVALGGMTLYRRPVGAALAMVAAGRRDLEILTLTGGIETDLLIGAGVVRQLRSCYTGLEVVGLAPHFTRSVRERRLSVVEETEYTLSYGVRAATMRVPFLPMRAELARTDIAAARPDLKPFACPLTGVALHAVPALPVDVAIVHAGAADAKGNCCLQGQLALDPHWPGAAACTIVTAERIVDTDTLRRLPGGITLSGHFVTHVVHLPGGSLPTSCFPERRLDMGGVLDYAEAAADDGAWRDWLARATEAYA